MAMLRGVLFDFNGTLAHLSSCGAAHHEVFDRHGLATAAARWGDGWLVGPADGETHEIHSRTRETYHHWELQRLRSRARDCGVPEDRVEALVRDLDRETKAIVMKVYDDAVDTLTELRRRGLRVAVCSNWYWELDEMLERVGLAGMFAAVVSSARVGMRKPDPRIYRHTLAGCGLAPDEAIYVGDMWMPDVEGPRAVGMRAVHLWRPERGARQGCPALREGIWRVDSLLSVVEIAGLLSGSADPARYG
jgi:putative hydrolase of the HAD superfamily